MNAKYFFISIILRDLSRRIYANNRYFATLNMTKNGNILAENAINLPFCRLESQGRCLHGVQSLPSRVVRLEH